MSGGITHDAFWYTDRVCHLIGGLAVDLGLDRERVAMCQALGKANECGQTYQNVGRVFAP